MFKTIRSKLFLTFLLTTMLLVVGMFMFMHWSLNRGFSEFIKTRHQERIENLLEGLSTRYTNDGSWNQLAGNKQLWINLLWQSNPFRQPPPWMRETPLEANNVWPPNTPETIGKHGFTPFELRVMLLDANHSVIYGRKDALQHITLFPIRAHEQTVGYLGLLPGKAASHASESRFLERQSQAFLWIALLMVGLSASLALLLAYLLGKPLKRITTAARALAAGRYDIRLPVESRDELGELARDFNDMASALEQSEKARQRWVQDISHELRTPLAVLRGELEALQDGIRPLTPEAVDSLFGEVMRLNRLTEDLYQLSLSDQGALSYRKIPLDPVEILTECLDTLAPLFRSKHIEIACNKQLLAPITVFADPDRLSQLFRNLLVNSAHYTDTGGHLQINVSRNSDKCLLVFADSEPGVPTHELEKLFERFYRSSNSRKRNQGGGLGLAICSNIVRAHHGSIYAEPSSLNGLAVHIELPLST